MKLCNMNKLVEYIFSFHQNHRAATHLLFWVLIYGFGVFAMASTNAQPQLNVSQNIALHLMMMIAKIPIAYWVVYISIPSFFDKKQYLGSISLFLVIYYFNFCLVIFYKISVYPFFQMYVVSDIKEFSIEKFVKDYAFSNLGAAAMMALIKLVLNRSEIQNRSILLEKQRSEIELKLLKTQLNPHFLFNTLNNIYSLSLLNSPKTAESIARISAILDHVLYRCDGNAVPILGEVELLQNYIALEKLRYDERLQINFCKKIGKDVVIAPLILLSLLENAFKHGASEDAQNPKIDIYLKVDAHLILFKVLNTLPAKELLLKRSGSNNSKGIGLENLRQQLALIYGANAKLSIYQCENEFSVVLQISLKKSHENTLLNR